MRWRKSFEGLDTLVAERGDALLATAVLLTGSRTAAEDLLQAALERLMRHWNRVRGDKEGYLRRTMYHLAIDQWRSRRRRPEVLASVEPPGRSDGTDALDDKDGPGETYGRYGQYPGKHDRLSLYSDGNTVLGAAAPDPATLFRALKDANATVTQRPDGTLHFEYATQTRDGSTTTSGDVTRGADGRVAKVALTGTWQSTAKGRLDTGTYAATLELFDYGVEVKVQRPADVVMAK